MQLLALACARALAYRVCTPPARSARFVCRIFVRTHGAAPQAPLTRLLRPRNVALTGCTAALHARQHNQLGARPRTLFGVLALFCDGG
jgi:hypothetical protein